MKFTPRWCQSPMIRNSDVLATKEKGVWEGEWGQSSVMWIL